MIKTARFSVIILVFSLILLLPTIGFAEIIQLEYPSSSLHPDVIDINSKNNVIWNDNDRILFYNGQGINSIGIGNAPQLNETGQAVWRSGSVQTPSIFLYNGFETTQLTNDSTGPGTRPRINNLGQVVWEGVTYRQGTEFKFDSRGIFLYNGGVSTQITSSPFVHAYDFNNEGMLAYSAGDNMYLYDGTTTTEFEGKPSKYIGLSDAGHLAYLSIDNEESLILYHDGISNMIASRSSFIDPQINNQGQLAWQTSGSNPGLEFYDGNEIHRLASYSSEEISTQFSNLSFELNEDGHLTWNQGGDIYLFDGTQTLRLTNTPGITDRSPELDASGNVVWVQLAQPNGLQSLKLYDGEVKTLDADISGIRQVNVADNGSVVWNTFDGDTFESRLLLYEAGTPLPPDTDDGGGDTEPPPPQIPPDFQLPPDVELDEIEVPEIGELPQNLEVPANAGKNPGSDEPHTGKLVNLLNPNTPLDPQRSTIVIAHGTDEDVDGWVADMTHALEIRLGSEINNYNVAAWDWSENAAANPLFVSYTGNNFILNQASTEGKALAKNLHGDNHNFTKDLHLIGHSAGGTVINQAAITLKEKIGPIGQITFLDAPESNYDFASPLDGNNALWADNYVSSLLGHKDGNNLFPNLKDIPGAYDYYLIGHLDPNPLLIYGTHHPNAHNFYEATINSTCEIDSYFCSKGFAWSKAGGEIRPSRDGSGSQAADIGSPIEVVTDFAALKEISVETFDTAGTWLRDKTAYLFDGQSFLDENSSSYLFKEMFIPENTKYFSFDFGFDSKGDGDYLTTHFNDDLLFWFDGRQFYGNSLWNTGLMDISSYAGQTGTWTFGLNGVGDINARARFDNLVFYESEIRTAAVPEPSTMALLGIGMGMLGFSRRRKIKG